MLKGKQKRFLRALASSIEPVVQIGKFGLGDNALASIEEALAARELIKIKVLKNSPQEPQEVADAVVVKNRAELVQLIGRNIIIYRPIPDKPVIELPQ